MKRALRYNELDELAWEVKHGCDDHAYGDECGDECWDEVIKRTAMPPEDEEPEDDETGPGIFGNELNHAPKPEKEYCTCVSNGKLFGHGEKDEIIRMVFDILEPFKDYHFEFGFFEAK